MPNRLQLIKVGMLLIGSVFAAGIGTRDLLLALRETEPTRLEIADFAETYADQDWLNVRGRVATEHAHVRPSTNRAHQGKNLSYVNVPIVADGWTSAFPVEVVATFGPIDSDRAIDWAALTNGEDRVEGTLRTGPVPKPDALVPGLSFSDSVVVINVGTEPSPPVISGVFTLFMIVTAAVSATVLWNSHGAKGDPHRAAPAVGLSESSSRTTSS
ncbi:hypothetical protein [Enhygromyxa salina]|uniref:hypothetical protein n=1 Tax=Enhygromyxa salina TaxID=215803 RepID=UPI0011B27866|nr:hypothetical protein [Enhygromyxa salina]